MNSSNQDINTFLNADLNKEKLNDFTNIKSIITLIENLKANEKQKFLKELIHKCKFSKDEFYSNNHNGKFELLYELFKSGIINDSNREKIDLADIEYTLDQIFKDLDGGYITKRKIENFFQNRREIIIKRLELIKLILNKYNPKEAYDNLKKIKSFTLSISSQRGLNLIILSISIFVLCF